VSEYCAVMARHHRETGDQATAAKFELLGGRHRERAAKLAALLPPA
jgi:ParB-like chromosome segregation protein Spo0J